jgi:hypothetical protein
MRIAGAALVAEPTVPCVVLPWGWRFSLTAPRGFRECLIGRHDQAANQAEPRFDLSCAFTR